MADMTCPMCGGAGKTTNNKGETRTCPGCNGSGSIAISK